MTGPLGDGAWLAEAVMAVYGGCPLPFAADLFEEHLPKTAALLRAVAPCPRTSAYLVDYSCQVCTFRFGAYFPDPDVKYPRSIAGLDGWVRGFTGPDGRKLYDMWLSFATGPGLTVRRLEDMTRARNLTFCLDPVHAVTQQLGAAFGEWEAVRDAHALRAVLTQADTVIRRPHFTAMCQSG